MIVSKLREASASVILKGEHVEVAFLADGQRQDICSVSVLASYFAHRITRNNADLRSHVERIQLFISNHHSTVIYSALVDLFLVLENNGLALRKRMLATAKTLLSDFQFEALRQTIPLGLIHEFNIPLADYALLTKGLSEQPKKFIAKRELIAKKESNAIDLAMDYIEHGQLELAQSTLLQAIIKVPDRLDLHNRLLEVFDKTEDKAQFFSCYEELLEKAILLPPRWREMAMRFGLEKG